MSTALACCACSGMSCLTNAFCGCFGRITAHSNKLTRLVYTFLFFGVSLSAWAWYTWGAQWYRENFSESVINRIPFWSSLFHCQEDVCFGSMSVYRILSILSIFYLIHALMAVTCPRTKRLHAKWWGLKIVLLVLSVIVTFFIPNQIFQGWAWLALVGGAFFILVQLVLLVEFAHSWTESWVANWDEDPAKKKWWWGLVISMVTLYLLALGLTIAEYFIFGHATGCERNTVLITVNLLLILLESALSVHPSIQEANPNSGLLQSATVAAYTSYLVYSALMSQPTNSDSGELAMCNELRGGLMKESFSAVTGALIVFVSVCYSAFRVSMKSDRLLKSHKYYYDGARQSILPKYEDEGGERIDAGVGTGVGVTGMVGTGVEATGEDSEEEEEDKTFNYTFFHICFALATCYVTMLITNWSVVTHDADKEIYVIDRSLGSLWVKIVSGWLAHLLYIWSLVAPVLLPNREWYT